MQLYEGVDIGKKCNILSWAAGGFRLDVVMNMRIGKVALCWEILSFINRVLKGL
jgi:hypothetical protein